MSRYPTKFSDSKHPRFRAAVNEMHALASEVSLDECRRAFATATAEKFEDLFARRYGVVRSKSGACIQRLLGKVCGLSRQKMCECNPPGTDHASMWLRDGKPHLFVSQPYNIRGSILEDATKFAADHGLELEIRTDDAFYFPSSAFVMIWRKNEDLRGTAENFPRL